MGLAVCTAMLVAWAWACGDDFLIMQQRDLRIHVMGSEPEIFP